MNDSFMKTNSLVIRNATLDDVVLINNLLDRVYPHILPGEKYIEVIASQLNHFPQGQFVVALNNQIIGYCASICVSGDLVLRQHTWDEITGNGYCDTHNPNGDFLYGVEACIDSEYRGRHLGHSLYNLRKALCVRLKLKGIILGGRLLHYAAEEKNVITPENYIAKVQNGELVDETLLFQLHNEFEVLGALKNYLPEDHYSSGHASHLIWRTPEPLSSNNTRD